MSLLVSCVSWTRQEGLRHHERDALFQAQILHPVANEQPAAQIINTLRDKFREAEVFVVRVLGNEWAMNEKEREGDQLTVLVDRDRQYRTA